MNVNAATIDYFVNTSLAVDSSIITLIINGVVLNFENVAQSTQNTTIFQIGVDNLTVISINETQYINTTVYVNNSTNQSFVCQNSSQTVYINQTTVCQSTASLSNDSVSYLNSQMQGFFSGKSDEMRNAILSAMSTQITSEMDTKIKPVLDNSNILNGQLSACSNEKNILFQQKIEAEGKFATSSLAFDSCQREVNTWALSAAVIFVLFIGGFLYLVRGGTLKKQNLRFGND